MLELPAPTAKQKEVLYLPAQGHTVVIGTAGSGKTTMALYRSLHLGNDQLDFGGDTALITYNKSLSNWMSQIVARDALRPKVLTFHGWARTILADAGVEMHTYLQDPEEIRNLRNRAFGRARKRLPNNRVFRRDPSFFLEELNWIDGMGIETLPDYKDANRTGRSETRLEAESREGVWAVRADYLELRERAGYQFDLKDIASMVLKTPTAALKSRYRHVVADEGQDLTPQMLRAIAYATPDSGSVTFFGDPTQQIYGNQMSWRSAGFHIRKQWRFDTNFRNTKRIAALAREIGGGASDATLGMLPDREGPLPQLVGHSSTISEITDIANRADSAANDGSSVAVLARTVGMAEAVAHAATAPTTRLTRNTERFESGAVYWGTVHAAKGFEFDEVFIVGLNDSSWPDSAAISRGDLATATDQDMKLLYVAVTRARTRLTLSYSGTPTDLLPADGQLYATG